MSNADVRVFLEPGNRLPYPGNLSTGDGIAGIIPDEIQDRREIINDFGMVREPVAQH